jgi:ParB-like nuclease domain
MRSLQQAKHSATHETAEAGIATLPSPTPGTTIQRIALNQLALALGSRRNMSRQSIQLLADRIHSSGQLHSLMVVRGEDLQYYVVAGDRRFAALQLLARDNRISPTFPVPCRVISGQATSQTEIAVDPALSGSDPDPKRCRFLDLRNRCPGLLTGSELARRRQG